MPLHVPKLHTCGVCGTVSTTRGGLTRHIGSTPDCRRAVTAKNRLRVEHAQQAPRHPGSDLDSDPAQDGDHMDIVYDQSAPVHAFDVDMTDVRPPTPSSTSSSSPSPTPPPPPPPPPPRPDRRASVEEVIDAEASPEPQKLCDAAIIIEQLLESRIESEFAAFASGDWGPFPSQADWDISKWAKTEAVSSGAINRLLEITALHAQLNTKSVRDINRRVDALPSPATFQYSEIRVSSHDDTFDLYWRDPLEVVADLLSDPTYAEHMTFAPAHQYSDAERNVRLYNELPSGDWMYQTQLRLPDGATVLPIIISSDKTELTSFTGKRSCYPVYLTLGNIDKHVRRQPSMRAQRLLAYLPTGKVDETVLSVAKARKLRAQLFHHCMQTVCTPLFGPAEDGIALADSSGYVRSCHPILAAYVADYPEQCQITCVRYGQACPRCDILHDAFDEDECGELRDQAETLQTIRNAGLLRGKAKNAVLDDAGLNDVPDPFWALWPYANIHCAITSDILHQLIQGVGKHLVEWLSELAPQRELDARFRRLPLAQGLRHFKDGISKLANVSGAEHRGIYAQLLGCVHGIVPDDAVRAARALLDFIYIAQYECHSDTTLEELKTVLSEFHRLKWVFQEHGVRADFKLPKLHMLQHYVESIKLFGAPDNYNTEATERLHIDLAKHAFRATNKRNFVKQMCRWLERREAVYWFSTYLAWTRGETFDARLKKRPRDHAPVVLAKRPHHARVFLPALKERYGVQDFRAAFKGFLRLWHRVPIHRGYETLLPSSVATALAAIPSVRVWNHVKFYTPNTQTHAAADILNVAYASAVQRRFDTVLVNTRGTEVAGEGGLADIRVARLRAIFTVPEPFNRALYGRTVPGHLAYVEWFTRIPAQRNQVNGMYPIRPEMHADGRRHAAIVEVIDIRRACQLFPKFGAVNVRRTLTPKTIVDAYGEFYLNNRADKDTYRSTHRDVQNE